MGLLDIFKKKENEVDSDLNKLSDIVYDYDGYSFMEKVENIDLYYKINSIITNNKFDINTLDSYNDLKNELNDGNYMNFFDEWSDYLISNNYMFSSSVGIEVDVFIESINKVLVSDGYNVQLDSDLIMQKYKEELEKLEINNYMNYDVLIGNVVATFLRNHNLELIALGNSDMLIISVDKIEELKQLEEMIN